MQLADFEHQAACRARTTARRCSARNLRALLQATKDLLIAGPAPRPRHIHAGSPVKQAVNIAGQVLNVYIDALVYRGAQHTARVVLWDVPIPSEEEAATMAAPISEALESAVGEDRAYSVEFWHLRSGKIFVIDKAMAQARAADAADAVRRAAGL